MDVQAVLVPLGCSAAGAAFCLGVLRLRRIGGDLRSRGVTARATVVAKSRREGGLENHYAVFAFTDREQKAHRVEAKVPSRAWHGLHEGDTALITYLRDDPSKVGVGPVLGRKIIGALLLYFAAVGAAVAALGFGAAVKELASGGAVPTEVLGGGLFAAAVIAAALLLARRYAARQKALLQAFAANRGWTFLGKDAAGLDPALAALPGGDRWNAYDVVRADGPRLWLFAYTVSHRGNRSMDRGVGCFAENSTPGCDGAVGLCRRIPLVYKLIEDRLEVGAPEFAKEWCVTGQRRDVAEAVVTPAVQGALLAHVAQPGWYLEVWITGRGVLATSPHATGPKEWDHLAALAQRLRSGAAGEDALPGA